MAIKRPNQQLRIERRKLGLSQGEVAEDMHTLAERLSLAIRPGVDTQYVSRWERGRNMPEPEHRILLCLRLQLPARQLGFPGDFDPARHPANKQALAIIHEIDRRRSRLRSMPGSDPTPVSSEVTPALGNLSPDADATSRNGVDATNRRDFLRYGVGAAITIVTGDPAGWLSQPEDSTRRIVDPLSVLGYRLTDVSAGEPLPIETLKAAVADAKRGYQACRYTQVGERLPGLLAKLNAAREAASGDLRLVLNALSAEANHVAASLFLKHDDYGPAWIAADRSMQYAQRSGSPLMIASSARILTHAFMSAGHFEAAADTASDVAQRFSATWTNPSEDDLSVYGSLLLRGAVAAARRRNRGQTQALLGEAAETGRRMGRNENLRWTGFGPLNVQLHRVHIALTLGDAGTAIEQARLIDQSQINLVERKVSLLLDIATALMQCGQIDESYRTLRTAELVAPEELAARPAVRQLVVDLIVHAPPHLHSELHALARRIGVTVLYQ